MKLGRWRTAGLLGLLGLLVGCGGSHNLLPLVDETDDPFAFERLLFRVTEFRGDPLVREALSATASAAETLRTGINNLNSVGPVATANRARSALDSFVFVPVRSRSRRPTVEIISEVDGEYTITGTHRYDPDDDHSPVLTELRLVGPQTDLRFRSLFTPPDRIMTEVHGRDVNELGWPIEVQYSDEAVIDEAAGEERGRMREENYRVSDGGLEYASDAEYLANLDNTEFVLDGQDIWFDRDGFWVRSQFLLLYLASEDHPDNGVVFGLIESEAADGTRFILFFDEDGTASGIMTDADGEFLAYLELDAEGNLSMFDEDGELLYDEDGEELVFDVDLRATSEDELSDASLPPPEVQRPTGQRGVAATAERVARHQAQQRALRQRR